MTRYLFALGWMIAVSGCQPAANVCFALETPLAPAAGRPQVEPYSTGLAVTQRHLVAVGCAAPSDLDALLNRR